TPGIYSVSLTVTDGSTNQSETKTAYITVLPTGTELPFYEGFENYNTLADAIGTWFVNNPGNNQKFEITNSAENSGSKSVKLANFGQAENNLHELASATVDLSNETIGHLTLSFRYAYRKRANNNSEKLKIYF